MAMPLLPWLSDSEQHVDTLMRAIAAAGASSVLAGALHLRPGARQWYLDWIAAEHPGLVPGYQQLYARSSYAPASYRSTLHRRCTQAAARYGLAWDTTHAGDAGPGTRTAATGGAAVARPGAGGRAAAAAAAGAARVRRGGHADHHAPAQLALF